MDLEVETVLSSRPQLGPNDITALTSHQQTLLVNHKVQVRIENEHYLRQHAEISNILESFLQKVLLEKPDNIKGFAASYFTHPALRETISKQISEGQN